MEKTERFKMGVDTKLMVAALEKVEIGQVVTYAELSKVIGRPVMGDSPPLQTAKRYLRKESGYVFDIEVFGESIRRLNDEEIVDKSKKLVGKIRRATRRTKAELMCVRPGDLRPEKRIEFIASSSFAGAMELAAKPTRFKLLVSAASQKTGDDLLPINTSETLELFKG